MIWESNILKYNLFNNNKCLKKLIVNHIKKVLIAFFSINNSKYFCSKLEIYKCIEILIVSQLIAFKKNYLFWKILVTSHTEKCIKYTKSIIILKCIIICSLMQTRNHQWKCMDLIITKFLKMNLHL